MIDNPVWVEMLKQLPAVGALIYLVNLFLRHQRSQTDDAGKRLQEMEKNHVDDMKHVNEELRRTIDRTNDLWDRMWPELMRRQKPQRGDREPGKEG